ncbi:capsule biosynthesis protein CapA [Enterococcus faecalis]|nr:capsule biosynthesis protein CapA [Enterococcus faecalis]
MNGRLTIYSFWKIILKNFWLMIATMLTSLLIVNIYIFFISEPVYENTVQIIVNQKTKEQILEAQSLQTDLQLVNTYSSIVKSPRILNIVSKRLSNAFTVEELTQSIEVQKTVNSQIMTISAKENNSKDARAIANQTAIVLKEEIPKIMNVDNVEILSEAIVSDNQKPIGPEKRFIYLLAMLVGGILWLVIVIIKESLNTVIFNEADIERDLKIPVLGIISDYKKVKKF